MVSSVERQCAYSPFDSREVTFNEFPILLAKSVYNIVNMNLDGVQLKMDLQPEILEVAYTSV